MISGNGMSYREWITRAKCAGDDPQRYELGTGSVDVRQQIARGLCRGCPVLRECALDALDHLAVGTVRAGVWIPGNNPDGLAWPQARKRLRAAAGGAQ